MISLPLCTLAFVFVAIMPATLQSKEMQSLETITEGSNRFAVDLYEAIKSKPGNILVSPICIHIAMSLAYHGANGKTAEEMAKVLHLPSDRDQILEGYRNLITHLEDPALAVATKIYTTESLPVKSEFQNITTNYYFSEVEEKDFLNNPKKTVDEINSWVENKTQSKIRQLLSEDDIDSLSRLVLINAIYFKSEWAQKFDSEKTHVAPFHISQTDTVNVQMMVMENKKFKYFTSERLQAQIFEMPFKGNEFSMIFILPISIDGLSYVEDRLSSINLADELSKLEEREVDILVPKFTIEQTVTLNEVLQSMGMTSAFLDGSADFSGISPESLTLSKVIQKAFVEINEEGVEAAAATTSTIRMRRAVDMREKIICNHPFGFMIIHPPTGSVIFASRLTSIDDVSHSFPHEEL